MRDLLEQLLRDQPLSESQAEEAFERIFRGEADDARIAALLALIERRGATVDELVGSARVMRRHAERVSTDGLPAGARVLDTCGTGGAAKTFNVSTAAAMLVAGAGRTRGIHVAKHGNRSRTGRGSAETLALLGVNIEAPPAVQARCLREVGVCFCFAILHHPAAKHAASVRQSLGVPTMFNLLGPLTNPAGATRQLLGVYDGSRVEPMAEALVRLGADRAMVVHSDDGMDEISLSAPTTIAEVRGGNVRSWRLDPASLGLAPAPLETLQSRDLEHAAAIISAVLEGRTDEETRPARDIVLLNAAAAFIVTDAADDLTHGLELARKAIDSGAALRTLRDLARLSHEHAE